jgi:uncharacterized protein YbaP (TraB family)
MNSLITVSIALLLSGCSAGPLPDEPLIFQLQSSKGIKSCLVALSHLVERPAIESANLIACEKGAEAIVFEANPSSTTTNFWSIYERKEADPKTENLTQKTLGKVIPALRASQYSEADIKYFLSLHPIAIYRALTYSKYMDSEVKLYPNIDIQIAETARKKKLEIMEIEGMAAYAESEKRLDIDKIDHLISRMADLVLSPKQIEKYKNKINKYSRNLSSQPEIDTAWRKKLFFNTSILELPSYTMWHDTDSRNELMASNIVKIVNADRRVLIFIGSAHIGGEVSVLKIMENQGLKIIRVQ